MKVRQANKIVQGIFCNGNPFYAFEIEPSSKPRWRRGTQLAALKYAKIRHKPTLRFMELLGELMAASHKYQLQTNEELSA